MDVAPFSEQGNAEVVTKFFVEWDENSGRHTIHFADRDFGLYQSVPERVSNLWATRIEMRLPEKQNSIELNVRAWDSKDDRPFIRPIYIWELIETVLYDEDNDRWRDSFPKHLTAWKLVFPERESWGFIRPVGLWERALDYYDPMVHTSELDEYLNLYNY